eukprot:CAMPEP_0171071616 /NCGR_PEP_ID=MMETSP0766_2-20121228/10419_1 /TAXON_ID=439317 /ORGANISM="Gambierdiscus australes, Strain CAWD 149" /LENGTH=185 /DNA_ID=CAMNT_0011528165 /DNA_START=142 /DNA_END=700 /DNA_ORIENTATION=+
MGLLEGCGPTPSCKIADVYPKLQVNGRTGLSRLQLAHAGVWLCARHSAKRETYKGAEACSEPEEVFTNGELPDILAGDVQALLLVRCPSLTYPGGQIMQRVTCSRDYYFAEPDGPLEQELSIHFDGNRKADNAAATPQDGRSRIKPVSMCAEADQGGRSQGSVLRGFWHWACRQANDAKAGSVPG